MKFQKIKLIPVSFRKTTAMNWVLFIEPSYDNNHLKTINITQLISELFRRITMINTIDENIFNYLINLKTSVTLTRLEA